MWCRSRWKHATDHAIAVGWYAVEQHDAAEFFEAGYDVAIGGPFLEEEVEMRHSNCTGKRLTLLETLDTSGGEVGNSISRLARKSRAKKYMARGCQMQLLYYYAEAGIILEARMRLQLAEEGGEGDARTGPHLALLFICAIAALLFSASSLEKREHGITPRRMAITEPSSGAQSQESSLHRPPGRLSDTRQLSHALIVIPCVSPFFRPSSGAWMLRLILD